MHEQNLTFKFGLINIQGPTASEKRCSIFLDLAELLSCEYTSEAVEKIKSAWSTLGKTGKLDIDAEAEGVSIFAAKSTILDLAILLNDLFNNPLDKKLVVDAKNQIKRWKQPEPFPWKIGDIFCIRLQDSLFAYGQVLDKTSYQAPTCVLLALKTQEQSDDMHEILNSMPISILHVHNDRLNDQSWKVIGNSKPMLDPASGSCGVRGKIGSREWDGLETLAKAWHGLSPWNQYYKDDYLDEYLLDGVERPVDVVLLNTEQPQESVLQA